MVSVCLPYDALLQHLPSYLGFSYFGRGVSLHGCSSKVQPLLLTLEEGCLLTPSLTCGIALLGPPAPTQPLLLARGAAPPGHHPWLRTCGSSSQLLPLTSDLGSSSPPFLHRHSLALSATAPDLGRGVTPLGHGPSGMGSSRLLPPASDVGQLLSATLSAPAAAAAALSAERSVPTFYSVTSA